MESLAGYESDDEKQNKKYTDKTVSRAVDLDAEWDSFEKLIGGAGISGGMPDSCLEKSSVDTQFLPRAVSASGIADCKDSVSQNKLRRRMSSSSSSHGKRNTDRKKSASEGDTSDSESESGEESTEESSDDSSEEESADTEDDEDEEEENESIANKKAKKKSESSSSEEESNDSDTSDDDDEDDDEKEDGASTSDSSEEEKKPVKSKENSKPKTSVPVISQASVDKKAVAPSRCYAPVSRGDGKKSRSRSRSPSHNHDRRDSGSHRHRKRRSRSKDRHRRRGSHGGRRGSRRSRSRDRRRRSRSRSRTRRHRSRSRDRHRKHSRRSRSYSDERKHRSHHRDRHSRRRDSRSRSREHDRHRDRSSRGSRDDRHRSSKRPTRVQKPRSYKDTLREKLLEAQKQAAEGKLELGMHDPSELMKLNEKPSSLPLNKIHPLMSIQTCPTDKVTPQQALMQTMAAMHQKAQEITGVAVPKYYNPAAVNPLKFAEQVKKRKLLWSKKEDGPKPALLPEPTATPTGPVLTPSAPSSSSSSSAAAPGRAPINASQWQSAAFIQDDDGKVAAKFRKLMGIKKDLEEQEEADANPEAAETLKKQQELFQHLDREYEFARMTTHTQRGVGLGFSSGFTTYK